MNDTLLEIACLPLYSESRSEGRFIPERNSLNMWNAEGRPRHPDEIGIPIPVDFRNHHPDFFPGLNASFELKLPNFTTLSAKQCQQGGKALMSNPNKDLGKWLLRVVLGIPKYTVITYAMLIERGIDSVYIEKWKGHSGFYYKMSPAPINTYDKYIRGMKITNKETPKNWKSNTLSAFEKNRPTEKPMPTSTQVSPIIGKIINHPKFGNGTILNVVDNTVVIDFGGDLRSLDVNWLRDKKIL